jgi:hypothetical protein
MAHTLLDVVVEEPGSARSVIQRSRRGNLAGRMQTAAGWTENEATRASGSQGFLRRSVKVVCIA